MSTYLIGIHSGNPNDPLGRREEFVTGGYNWLIDKTREAFDLGWPDVRWHQFRGNPGRQRLYASACGRRVHTPEEIAVLDARMHTLPRPPSLYTGVWIQGAGTLVLDDGVARYPDPAKPNDAAWLRANWELFLGYGVRDIMLDNSITNKPGAVKLSGWFAERGVTMGIEGWDIDWTAQRFGGLSWRLPSLHTMAVLDRHDPHRTLHAHDRPASAKHRPTVLVQRAWDNARGMLTPPEEIAARIIEVRSRGFKVDYQGEHHSLIQQACLMLV